MMHVGGLGGRGGTVPKYSPTTCVPAMHCVRLSVCKQTPHFQTPRVMSKARYGKRMFPLAWTLDGSANLIPCHPHAPRRSCLYCLWMIMTFLAQGYDLVLDIHDFIYLRSEGFRSFLKSGSQSSVLLSLRLFRFGQHLQKCLPLQLKSSLPDLQLLVVHCYNATGDRQERQQTKVICANIQILIWSTMCTYI